MFRLAHQLPGTLKSLSKSQLPGTLESHSKSLCLLPSLLCLKNGCHGCNRGLLRVDYLPDVEATGESSEPATSGWRMTEDNPRVDSPAAVCEALEDFSIEEESTSICIPVHPCNNDRWTKFLIKFLKSKEKEAKGIKVMASEALEKYTTRSTQELGLQFQTRSGCIFVTEIYDSASLILPRLAEILVNIVLTGWLRVDGFSSSLVARRAIRDYIVDSTGNGFAANAFLKEATVFCSGAGSNVCQLLRFRGGVLSVRRVSYIVACVNVFCSIAWSVLIACEGNWAPSMPLSIPRLAVIIGAVAIALGMDCFDFCGTWARARARARAQVRGCHRTLAEDQARARVRGWHRTLAEYQARARARGRTWDRPLALFQARIRVEAWDRAQLRDWARAQVQARTWARAQAGTRSQACLVAAVVILEVGCIVTLSMKKGLGKWVYSVMQVLVWVKWGFGSFLLGDNANEDEFVILGVRIENLGTWVYCSAFLLNAMLAGVRRKWVYYLNL